VNTDFHSEHTKKQQRKLGQSSNISTQQYILNMNILYTNTKGSTQQLVQNIACKFV